MSRNLAKKEAKIAVLDRSFSEMELLKQIYATVAILGIHVSWPYLLMQKETV